MAYDDKDPSKEVKSLASRFPKRGIDPTIPEGVRRQMMDIQRQEELDKGIKAHEERRLSKGGSAKGMNMKKAKKFDDGGALTPDQTAGAIDALGAVIWFLRSEGVTEAHTLPFMWLAHDLIAKPAGHSKSVFTGGRQGLAVAAVCGMYPGW